MNNSITLKEALKRVKHRSTVYPIQPQMAPEMLSPLNPHADHNEKRLEAQGQQGAEIVLPRVAPLPVHHCGKGDCGAVGNDVCGLWESRRLFHRAVNICFPSAEQPFSTFP